jgi:hypothetical protein
VVIEDVIYYLELMRKILYRTNVIARRSLPKQSPVLWEFQIKRRLPRRQRTNAAARNDMNL